jgi:hypothetical protein
MKPQHLLPLALLSTVVLAACPGPDAKNPPRLWLVLNGSEVMVRLGDQEPPHI